MEGETSDHDVDAGFLGGRVFACGGNPSSGPLQHEREEVAEDEGEGVGSRLEPREALAIDDDDACETKVDGGAEEGGADGEADEVSEISSLVDRKGPRYPRG